MIQIMEKILLHLIYSSFFYLMTKKLWSYRHFTIHSFILLFYFVLFHLWKCWKKFADYIKIKQQKTTERIKKRMSNRLKSHECMTEIYIQWWGKMNGWYSGMEKNARQCMKWISSLYFQFSLHVIYMVLALFIT